MTDTPFIFDSYHFDPTTGVIKLTYQLGDVVFVETIVIPMNDVDLNRVNRGELDHALFALHLMAGISYWKTTCSKEIKIWSGELSQDQAAFWEETYTRGLGEFFYKNKIDFRGLISFPFSKSGVQTPALAPSMNRTMDVLVPIGGGKDSIVTAELLKSQNVSFSTLTIKEAIPIKKVSEQIGAKRLIVERTLAPTLIEFNTQPDVYNGHVPITAILSFLSVVVAILYQKTNVVFSLEQTADEGNLEYLGQTINHQYSKTLVFERALQTYLSTFVTKNVRVFSLIRPLSEFAVVQRFAKLETYFPIFSSCNKNFTFENTKAGTHTFWCGTCPKCAFMFVMLCAWLPHKKVVQIFGSDLFSKSELIGLFKQLLGIKGHKPFECVGTAEETAAALELCHQRGGANNTIIMKLYIHEVRDAFPDRDRVIIELQKPSTHHAIPPDFIDLIGSEDRDSRIIENFSGKKILLVGFAATNQSFLRAIKYLNPQADITIADQSTDIAVPDGIRAQLGSSYLDRLSDFELIIRSPGVPVGTELAKHKDRLTTATELFFHFVRTNTKATIIGVTGTKGKSTTSTLIYNILLAAGKHALLVGNINTQEWDLIYQITNETMIVYELSSYMLYDFHERPDISVWLNVYDDHLTWHGDVLSYTASKANICAHQTPEDICIYNGQNKRVQQSVRSSKATLVDFTQRQDNLSETKLKGTHNRENMLAALCVMDALGIPESSVLPTLQSFTGLPHRLEIVARINDVEYVDDLLATNPESTLAAIQSFEHISCLILGGEDRGYDYTQFGKKIAQTDIKHILLLPGCRDKLKTALKNFTGTLHEVETLKEAVYLSHTNAPPHSIVLLSPAAPSYDQFKNYEEKAQVFLKAIQYLT